MIINRERYLNKIIQRKHNRLVKIITGIRRCGKSYLLFNLFYSHLIQSGVDGDHIIKIALDDWVNKDFRDPDRLYTFVKNSIRDNKMYYILLDEVQLITHFEDVLNGLMHINNCDVYVTRSNAKFLSKDIITEFRGRGDQIHIYPLSFAEFLSVYTGSKDDAWKEYMLYGGLPNIVLMQSSELKKEFLINLFNETYLNDVINRYNIRNDAELGELINILASSVGSLTNPNKLSDTFKSVKKSEISNHTIKSYLDYFEDSFLIQNSLRYDVKGKKYINTPSKYYFTDIGLRNARLNFRQLEENHIMENTIYNELKIRGFSVDVGVVTLNTKDADGKSIRKQLEIDFICNKGDQKYYIQSAFRMDTEEKEKQELRSLKSLDDSFKKIIVLRNKELITKDENGYLRIGLLDFLLNDNSLDL
ncbi:MAG: ATP-binding protein [Erysipelotrichaceae bacterium]|nr:ATP-binding protein [Erysipelotrichaceae bacterium]